VKKHFFVAGISDERLGWIRVFQTSVLNYRNVEISPQQSDLGTIAQHMFELMLRNVASDGFVFADPLAAGSFSTRGCIIASPSYPVNLGTVDQDYVFNWTRDAAITAMELAASGMPTRPGEAPRPLIDYVNFANICQNSGALIGHACYTIEGQPRPWTDQSDGPALQTLAILRAYSQLDAMTQATAQTVIGKNINYLLGPSPTNGSIPVYQDKTTNLWEERSGFSFFARAVQLRCFQAITANTYGISVATATAAAITWLQSALVSHFNGSYYVTLLPQIAEGDADFPYDPNSDIVMASIYGAIPCTDTKLLSTAAQIRSYWEAHYPINATDQTNNVGPMVGRYPGDTYDGDVSNPVPGGHPWAPCTCNFAELYYTLANAVSTSQSVPLDSLSAPFFAQIGVQQTTPWNQAVTSLQNAGDAMLNAIVFHSDHLELSEQFDGTSGFEKSVSDLTWSYASFVSAVRAKTGTNVLG
jgi:glucoamylase